MLKKLKSIFNESVFSIAIFSSILIFISIIIFPIIAIKINERIYGLTGFFILTNNSFKLFYDKESIFFYVNIPIILKITIAVILISIVITIILFHFNKYNIAATIYLICSILIFFIMLSINILKKDILYFKINSNDLFISILWPYKIISFLFLFLAVIAVARRGKEKLAQSIFFCSAATSIIIACSILIYIFATGIPGIFNIGFFKFLFNDNWSPNQNEYGIVKLMLSSIFATFGAAFLAVPFGVLCAIFLSEIAPKKLVFFIKPIVEILSGIPSVVYGFFGMTVIVPTIKKIFKGFNIINSGAVVGDSLLAVILVLFIMIIPTIISTSFVAIKNTPKSFKEASLNLGATKTETIFKVTIKSAKPGIFVGITLAVSKAIGETMAVMMVAGNIPNPPSLLAPTKMLTTAIAMDMSYATGLFRDALFGIGFVLFLLIFIVNLSFKAIYKKSFKL